MPTASRMVRAVDKSRPPGHMLTGRSGNPLPDLRLMLDSSGEGLYGLDTDGRCTLVNPAAAELFGYTTSELVGQPIHDLLHHSRPDRTLYPHAACPILRAFGTGHGIRVDGDVFWHKDGSMVNVEYTARPIVENGLIVGAVVAVRDIRERKDAERGVEFQA